MRLMRALIAFLMIAVLSTAALLSLRARPAWAAAVPLNTTEFGKGPTLVFVHGLGASRMTWIPTAKLLRDRYHIVLVDLPGHGESRTLPDPFSLDAVAEALDGVLAKQNADSTIVVADGLGGLITLTDLGVHPGRARALFLVNAGLKSPVPIADQDQRYFLDYLDNNYDQFLDMLYKRAGRDSAQGVTIHALASQADPVAVKAYFRQILNADGNKPLKNYKGPIALVVSDKNWSKDKTWGETAKVLGWDDTTRVAPMRLENAALWAMQDQPEKLAEAIAGFAAAQYAARK